MGHLLGQWRAEKDRIFTAGRGMMKLSLRKVSKHPGPEPDDTDAIEW